jgi:hypothetical protein
MKFKLIGKVISALGACMALNGAFVVNAHATDYSFVVHNSTDSTITQILVSEDGRKWGQFRLGSGGIKPGKAVKLVWDSSTNSESCQQYVKAVYADGSQAKPTKFDFCENDLEIEF